MNIKKYQLSIFTAILALLATSCIHDDFKEPDTPGIPTGNVLTISDLRQIYVDSVQSGIYPDGYTFEKDFSVYCVCTMDDKSGNIYKSAYVEDNNDALNLHLLSSGGLYEGDSVRIYLKGLILGDYENMLQLDSVHVDNNIVKVATDKDITPEVVTIGNIQTGNYQAKLVELKDVQFVDEDLGKKWADAVNLVSKDRTIEDCNGNTLIVRTSGYADFASQTVPAGNGSMKAIVGQFRDDWQLLVRNTYEGEINMDGLRCGEYDTIVSEFFSSLNADQELNLNNWENIASPGNLKWTAKSAGGVHGMAATIFGENASASDVKSWLIAPEIDLSGSAIMKFETRGANDQGGTLKAYISTDYTGDGSPQTATWTELNANISDPPPSEFAPTWTESGEIDLSSYSGKVYIAFKYEGSDSLTTTFYLDNFMIYYQ